MGPASTGTRAGAAAAAGAGSSSSPSISSPRAAAISSPSAATGGSSPTAFFPTQHHQQQQQQQQRPGFSPSSTSSSPGSTTTAAAPPPPLQSPSAGSSSAGARSSSPAQGSPNAASHHLHLQHQPTPSSPLAAKHSKLPAHHRDGFEFSTPPPSSQQDTFPLSAASTSSSPFAPSAFSTPSIQSPAAATTTSTASFNPIANNSNSSTTELREWYRRERVNSGAGPSSSSIIVGVPHAPSHSANTSISSTNASFTASALAGAGSAAAAAGSSSAAAAAAAAATSSSPTAGPSNSTTSGGLVSQFAAKRRERESRTSESKPRRPSSVFDLAGSMIDRFKGKMSSSSASSASPSHHSRGESSSTASSKAGLTTLSVSSNELSTAHEDMSPIAPDSPSVTGSNASVHSVRQDRLAEPEAVEVLHSPTAPYPSSSRKFSSGNSNNINHNSSNSGQNHDFDRERHGSNRDGAASGSRGAVGMRRTSSGLDRVYIQVTDDNERFAVVDVSDLGTARQIKQLMFTKLRLIDPNDPGFNADILDAFQVFRTEIGVEEGKQASMPFIDDDSLLALCLQFGDDRGSLKFLVKQTRPSSVNRGAMAGGSSVVASPHQMPNQVWADRDQRSPSAGQYQHQQQHHHHQQQASQASHRSNTSSISSSNEGGLHRSRAQVKRHGHSASASTEDSFGLSPSTSSTPAGSSLPYVQGRQDSVSDSSPRYQHAGANSISSTSSVPSGAPLHRGGSDGPYDGVAMSSANTASRSGNGYAAGDDGRPTAAATRSSSFSTQASSMAAQAARDAALSGTPSRSQSATVATSGGPGGNHGAGMHFVSGHGSGGAGGPQTPSPSREINPVYENAPMMQSSQSAHGQMQPPPLNRNTSQPSVSSGYPAWSTGGAGMPPLHSASVPGSSVTSPQLGGSSMHSQHSFAGAQFSQHQHQQQQQQVHPAGLRPGPPPNGLTLHSTKSMDDLRMRSPMLPHHGTMPMGHPANQPRPPPPGSYTGPEGRQLSYPTVAVTRPPPSANAAALAPFDPRMGGPSPGPSPQMRPWNPQTGGPIPGPTQPPPPPHHYLPAADPRFRSPSAGAPAAQRASHYDPRYPPPPPLPPGYAAQQGQQGRAPHQQMMGPLPPHGPMGVIPPQRPMSAVPMAYSRPPPPLPSQGGYPGYAQTPPPPSQMHPPMARPPTAQQQQQQHPSAYGTNEFGGRSAYGAPGLGGATFPTRPHTYHDSPHAQQQSGGWGGMRQPNASPSPGPTPLVVREDPFTSAQFPNSSLRQVTQFQVAPTKLQPGMTVQQSLQARNAPVQQQQQQQQGVGPSGSSQSQAQAHVHGSSQQRVGTPSSAGSGSGGGGGGNVPIWAVADHEDPYHRAEAVARLTHEAQQQQQQHQRQQQQQQQQQQQRPPPIQVPSGPHPRQPPSPGYSPRSITSSIAGLRVSNPSSTTPQSPHVALPPIDASSAAAAAAMSATPQPLSSASSATPRDTIASSSSYAAERSSGSSFATTNSSNSAASSHMRVFSGSGAGGAIGGVGGGAGGGSGGPGSSGVGREGEMEGGGSSAPTSARSSRSEVVFSPIVEKGKGGAAAAAAVVVDGASVVGSLEEAVRSPRSATGAALPGTPQSAPFPHLPSSSNSVSSPRSGQGHFRENSAGADGMSIRPDLLLGTVPQPHRGTEPADEDEDTLRAEKWESLRSVLTPSEAQAAQAREQAFKDALVNGSASAAQSSTTGLGFNAGLGSPSGTSAALVPHQSADVPPPLPEKVRTGMSPASPPFARSSFADEGGDGGTFASFASFEDEDDEAGTWAQPLDSKALVAGRGLPLSSAAPSFSTKAPVVEARSGEATLQPGHAVQTGSGGGEGSGSGTGSASPRPPKLRIQTVPTIIQPARVGSSNAMTAAPVDDGDDDDDEDDADRPKSSAASSTAGGSQAFAKDGNDWALRPPAEELYDNLDNFFPKHDLDRPVVDSTTIPGSPLVGSPKSDASGLSGGPFGLAHASGSGSAGGGGSGAGPSSAHAPLSPFPARTRHKRSIRIAAEDGKKVMERKQLKQRVGGVVGVPGVSAGLARRASTKLWGGKVVEMTPGQEPSSAVSAGSAESDPDKPIFKWVKGDLIGKGTYGRVYLALNVTNGEMIAVKQVELPRTDSDRDNARQKGVVSALRAEIQTLKDLDHPHIVSYLGFEGTDAWLSIFLEYVPGGSVGSCIRKYGRFEEPVVSFFLHQILEGLAYLHDKGILHRDLKADNILVDWDGICKISDFGTVRKTDDIYNNQEMSLQGSIFWMAPEVINMTADGYSAKVDIWSLGCVVLEMLAGRRPWSEQEAVQAMLNIGSKKQTPPIPNDVDLSIQARHFLGNTFEIDPTTRPTALKLLTHVFCYVPPEFHFEDSKLHAAMSLARRMN